jgi:transposase
MRKIREVLRLHFACGLSKRRIARAVGVGVTAAGEYVARARRAGLGWPLPDGLDDAGLERLLFPPPPKRSAERPEPEWATIHLELRRPGVTLALLWEEYRARHPKGYGYSWFCQGYRGWARRLSPTLRQTHVAGEKMFVDYSGQTVEVIDGRTGEVREAEIFVAVLGASNYSYAEASWTQGLPDWVGAHARAFQFFGGVPRQTICDNLKAGVTRACRYEPGINRTYQEMAAHFGTAVLPTRVRKPRDKAKSLPLRRRGSRPAFWSSSAGSWPACAIAASSPPGLGSGGQRRDRGPAHGPQPAHHASSRRQPPPAVP